MKLKITVLATLLLTALNVLAITIKWDVDATDARGQSFTAYHGETLTFATTFRADGLALSNVTASTIYYQTNGMGTAWWHTDGLTFAPSNDVGATSYRFFIAAADPTGTVYRANGTLRMLASPGYSPNALTLPRETIDFAAIDVSNAPWATTAALASMSNSIPKTAADVGALERSWQDESYGPSVVLLKRTMSTVTSPLFKVTETPGPGSTIYSWYADGFTVPWSKVTGAPAIPTDEHINDVAVAAAADKADASTVEALSVAVNEANAWAQGTFNFLSGNTNAWFAGTNYVTGADITNKMHFTIEEGMDLLTMPCSMALLEIRDGQRGCVWDQRDWTAWYWKFKSQQMMAQVAASNAVIHAEIASDANHAWAKHYASSGRVNPDSSTTYIDTKRVCLSPGMAWETVAEVNGAAYWTIVGNGAVFGGSGTNAILEIKDFEGNAIMTITKGEHQLVGLLQESFTNDGPRYDADGWACFEILANVQPVGYFSVTPYAEDFVAETSSDCPALFRWEQITAPSQGVAGKWRIHFLLKPEIIANACFAKFLVEVQGQTQVKYTAGMNIEGGLIYGGKKIVPVIPVGAQAGDTITWKVAQ